MNTPCPKNSVVWICWRDAVGDSIRTPAESIDNICLVTNINIGWIIHENEERVVLAHGSSTSGEIDHITIPTNCICEREYIVAKKIKRIAKEAE